MYEILVGLQVTDDETYQDYREAMLPILKAHGGGFGYDFRVSEVLINQSENPINRVFTLNFPGEEASKKFFGNSAYLEVKEKYFNKSVGCTTIISRYEK